MSEKKIVVPEGMLKAVIETYSDSVEVCLKKAMCWLADNPIVPTEKQWDETADAVSQRYREKVGPSFNYHHAEVCAEWQRRMFLAPEPNLIVEKIKNCLRGVTLSPSDADEIVEELSRTAHGWSRRGKESK